MTRLFAVTVTRNEQHRYLRGMLANLMGEVDAHFCYDDRSTDETPEICRAAGAVVVTRDERAPSFLEDESAFRQDAWSWFEAECEPKRGDWVLAIDADEIASAPIAIGKYAAALVVNATGQGANAVMIPIPEVWVAVDGHLQVRTDGWWARIIHPRLFAYEPGGRIPGPGEGAECRCVPSYVRKPAYSNHEFGPHGLNLLHFGYARAEDRQAKYDRYKDGFGGHSSPHVESILKPPTLAAWHGPEPRMTVG